MKQHSCQTRNHTASKRLYSFVVPWLVAAWTCAWVQTVHAQSPSVDPGFTAGATGMVYALAMQADGKILVGGAFTALSGQPRICLGRLHADGTVDPDFTPEADSVVCSLAMQADGKILVGGVFLTLGGQTRLSLARLNADGTVDPGFDPEANSGVFSLAAQADGKILVGGAFTNICGQTRNRLARLNADGTLDPAFNPSAMGSVWSLAVQGDGKILVGGNFTNACGQARNYLARLNADGTLDTDFNPGADSWVRSLAVQADGKILVGGRFTVLGGQPRSCLGRLNADGTVDAAFDPGPDSDVFSVVGQADGKILLGGNFGMLGGQQRVGLGRLNADGTLDAAFNPNPNGNVFSLAIQPDGKILVGGGFSVLAGQTCNDIGRLSNTGPATETLSCDGSTITWLRGGTGPEVWRTTFEYSTNGISWSLLGAGTRITGGWQLGGVSVPAGTLRARGYTTGGRYNGSCGVVENGGIQVMDSDGDGVPDWWTRRYFGHPTGIDTDRSRAGDDADGTGMNNIFKFVAGLDPTNAASVFALRLERVHGQPAQKRVVFSPRRDDRTYNVLTGTVLIGGGSWTNLGIAATNDNGMERSVIDLDDTGTKKYYRVRIALP